MKHINPFDRMVQEQLAQEAEPAPMHLWDDIDTRMTLQDQSEKDKKRRWLLLFLLLFTTGTSAWLSYENFHSVHQDDNLTIKPKTQDDTKTDLNLGQEAQPARNQIATNWNTESVRNASPNLPITNEILEIAKTENNTPSVRPREMSPLIDNREQFIRDETSDVNSIKISDLEQKTTTEHQPNQLLHVVDHSFAKTTKNKAITENKNILPTATTTEKAVFIEKKITNKPLDKKLSTEQLPTIPTLNIKTVRPIAATIIEIGEQQKSMKTVATKVKTKTQHKKKKQKQASEYKALKRFFRIAPDPGSCYSFGGKKFDLRGIYIDAVISSDLPFRTLDSKDSEMLTYKQMRDNSESYYWAGTGSLRLSVVTNSGLAFRTGLVYAQITERFKYDNLLSERIIIENIYDHDNNIIGTDTLVEQGRRKIEHSNHYKMFDIPLIVGYEIESKKLVFNFNAGLYLNLLFTQSGRILSSNLEPIDINNKTMFRKNLGVSYFTSMGFNYKFTRDLHLIIEPQLRYYPKSFTRDSYEVSQKYVNFGVFAGLRFRL